MNKLNQEQKIIKYLTENRVFPLSSNHYSELWGVEGSKVYTVIYDKIKQVYNCSCNNLRKTDCAHICCVKKIKK